MLIFLKSEPDLGAYAAIMIDEAHEVSTDYSGYLQGMLLTSSSLADCPHRYPSCSNQGSGSRASRVEDPYLVRNYEWCVI